MDSFKLNTGAIPSPAEPTAWTLASVGATAIYPSRCIISEAKALRVSMQGTIGCCVGCTFEEIVRMMIYIQLGTQEELSWRWVYAICKALDGYADEGTYPSLAASVIRNFGVPLAKYFPNDVSLDHETFVLHRQLKDKKSIAKILGQAALDDATTRKSGADLSVPVTAIGVKQAVSYAKKNKGGVAILRRIGEEYWTDAQGSSTWKKKKLLPLRAPASIVSGHEEMLYGYLDITKKDRADLVAGKTDIDALIKKYPDESLADATRTETLILWLNHWSAAWCSTSGIKNGTKPADTDGGFAYEFLDTWLPFIGELRVVVPALPPAPPTFQYHFSKVLSYGMKGPDVVALQHALQIEGVFPMNQAFTGFFGDITLKAVKDFQSKYASEILTPAGVTAPTGKVGTYTLRKLNQLFST